MEIFHAIAVGIGIVGIVIIAWGVLLIIFEFLHLEYMRLTKKVKVKKGKHQLRLRLGSYILIGLEFMIAGDVINTVLKPDRYTLINLGIIVIIRTIISYFLNLEIKNKM